MKSYFSTFIVLLTLGCTSYEDKLSEGSWNINNAIYNNQDINFKSHSITLKMLDGNGVPAFWFSKDGHISLPGIDTKDIFSKWSIDNNLLFFKIDSAYYFRIYDDKIENDVSDFFEKMETVETDSIRPSRLEGIRDKNPILTGEFKNAFEIYKEPFLIEINGDKLVMKSKTTYMICYKDKTIEKMFRGLQ